jgi:glycosyltransferase involved in cell wall biosynthesis
MAGAAFSCGTLSSNGMIENTSKAACSGIANLPLVTIGLTCFNAEKTIERALRSALKQDWPHLEVIAVDDVSSDASWETIDAIAQVDSRVKAIRRSVNGGPAAARNTILNAAAGEFIAFFDDDDESLPERIRIQYETIREYERLRSVGLIACYGSGRRYYPNGYVFNISAIGSQPKVPSGELTANYLLFNNRVKGYFYGGGTPTCSLMARRSTFCAVGFFDENLRRVEDIDFAIRLALQGGHFIGCPQKVLYQYSTAASDKTALKNFEAELYLIDKHAEYLKQKRRYHYARSWFGIRYYHFSKQHLKFFFALIFFLLRHPFTGAQHFFRSAPGRWRHERKMRGRQKQKTI